MLTTMRTRTKMKMKTPRRIDFLKMTITNIDFACLYRAGKELWSVL